MKENGIIRDTPIEKYVVGGVDVFVKREDLCAPEGCPNFSKVRGLYNYLYKAKENGIRYVGVLDTRHSQGGLATAFFCKQLGLKCINFYPKYKDSQPEPLQTYMLKSQQLGAEVVGIKAGMSAVLYNIAKKRMKELPLSVMVPNGLRLSESVEANAEVALGVPSEYFGGVVIVSVSTGTICKGIWAGLAGKNDIKATTIIAHMGHDRKVERLRKWIAEKKVDHLILRLINEKYNYSDSVINSDIPFPCCKFYDAKAFLWMVRNIHLLSEKYNRILFWNIG